MPIDKSLVQRRFASAVPYYDSEATPQRKITEWIVELLVQQAPLPEGPLFEIGCGTGLLSLRLVQHYGKESDFLFNDLCPESEAALREKVGPSPQFLCADAEQHPWHPETYALIAAASCIQWWHVPAHFFTKAYEALRPEGVVAFGTYGPDNLTQLRQVTGSGLAYLSLNEIRAQLTTLGYRHITLREEHITLHFDTLLSLLRHLKLTGVNAVGTTPQWSPALLLATDEEYRRRFAPEGAPLPLTYHAIVGTARK